MKTKTIAFIELPCDPGEARLAMSFVQFKQLSPAERLSRFDAVAKDMCSDGWREKFRKFLEITGSDADLPSVIEVLEHVEPNLEEKPNTTGCSACHGAFHKLLGVPPDRL